MRILAFVRKFNVSTHTFIYNELEGLRRQGHAVKVLCTERLHPEKYPFPDVEVAPLSVPARFLANRLHQVGLRMRYPNPPLRRTIVRVVDAFAPDVIHCHFGPDGLYFLDNYAGTDRPVFIHFHGYDASIMLKDELYRDRLNELFRRPDVFPIFVSNFMLENVRKHGIEVPKYFILYYGTNTDFFPYTPDPPPGDKLKFLQISSIREKKGHPTTLRALARWATAHPEQAWEFILTGGGPEEEQVRALARELGIEQHLRFAGFVNGEQAKALLAEAHVFLHHSVTGRKDGDMEGIPNAIMEAMAAGLPVLSTWHSGIPELVTDGVNGYLVPERDVDAYALRLADIMHWQRRPENRAKVEHLFEQRQHAASLTAYYEQAREKLQA